ncbi:50S ribosomal protein L24 [Clostridia bacterium]|nr:50S ribosomal protein L24 [Clostridia bacterium]GHU74577.1 50S ribosomal protein L24 [Clostridia bacterium]
MARILKKPVIKSKIKLRKGDNVVITAGKDKGRQGHILSVDRKAGRVIVESANIVHKHQKPTQASPQGGIIKREAPIHVSNVAYLHKGKPTRIGYKLETAKDGRIVKKRFAKSTGDLID